MADTNDTRSDWDRGSARTTTARKNWTARIFTTILRLTIWYSIANILFRCPNSPAEITAATPQVCRPYLIGRDQVMPHLEPYYTAYAASYIDVLRPYIQRFNETVYNPGSTFAISTYHQYGEPTVAQLQAYTEEEWVKVVKPRLDGAQESAWIQYEKLVAPYVGQASTAVQPYVSKVKNVAMTQYQSVIVPTYRKAHPYASNAYTKVFEFTTDIAIPYGKWTGEMIVVFLQRRIWPPIRIAYGENVQPQLLKIRERLANYRDSKKLEAAIEAVDSSIASESLKVHETANPSSASTSHNEMSGNPSTTSVSSQTPIPSEMSVQEKVIEDLKHWQARFAKAADRGAEDLRERVAEISSSQIENQVRGTAAALLTQLEDVANRSLTKLRKEVVKIIQELSDETTLEGDDDAKERIRSSIRESGNDIKKSAQKLRSWRKEYNEEIDSLVVSASESTLEVVDGIRDLGLQEIGMRWASMDGVTHKDWNKYHSLKKTVDEWRHDIQNIITSHDHLLLARQEAEKVESKGMAIAENAAKELARLKDVIVWKVEARDTSDDFSSRAIPAAAVNAARKVGEKIDSASEALAGTTSTGAIESLASVATEGLEDAISSGSSFVEPAVEVASSVGSGASLKASSFVSPALESASSISDSIESNGSSASSAASSRASRASSSSASEARPLSFSASSMASEATEPMSEESPSSSVAKLEPSSISSSMGSPAIEQEAERDQRILKSSDLDAKPFSAADSLVSSLSSRKHSSSSDFFASSSATVVPHVSSFTVMVDDVIKDDGMEASSSLVSAVSEAGDDYAKVTESVRSAMSSAASA